MQSFDNSVGPDNPAKSGNDSGKLWENCADVGDRRQTYRFAEFEIDPANQRLLLCGKPVALRNRPFEVLLYLVQHRGRLVEQSELLGAIWGASDVYHNALRKAVGSVRSALGDDSQQPRFIETHWGKGYRFIGEVVDSGTLPAEGSLNNPSSTVPVSAPVQPQTAIPNGIPLVPAIASVWERGRFTRIAFGCAGIGTIAIAALFLGTVIVARSHRSQIQSAQTLDAPPAVSKSQGQFPQEEAQRADYHEAQYLLSQRRPESIVQAIERFERIVRSDPRSGEAYAALAECYALGYWGFWKIDPDLAAQISARYAEEAVRADPGSAYAHAQLAAALLRQLKVGDAQLEFERALAIRPNDAEVHHAYGVFLDDTYRADRGIAEMKRAIDLEPLSLAYKTDLGMSYFFAKRYEDAIAQYRSVLALDSSYVEAHEYLASMYVYQAKWAEARAEYAAIDRIRGTRAGDFGQSPLRVITEFRTGEEKKANTGVQAILASPSVKHAYALAKIYAQLGRPGDALRYLRQVVNSRTLEMFSMRDDPMLAPLHGDPEFEALANRVSTSFSPPVGNNPVQAVALAIPARIAAR
jgi:DNA-binding winged helix-turn-helix (wHTH) protein/Tfp pilus assembly protein PilF